MATHDVTFELPTRGLGRSDVKFQIKRDGEDVRNHDDIEWVRGLVSQGCFLRLPHEMETVQRIDAEGSQAI